MIKEFILMLEDSGKEPRLTEYKKQKRLYEKAIRHIRLLEKLPINPILAKPGFEVNDRRYFLPFECPEFQNYIKASHQMEENEIIPPLCAIPGLKFADLFIEHTHIPETLEKYGEYGLSLNLGHYVDALEDFRIAELKAIEELDAEVTLAPLPAKKLRLLKDKSISYVKMLKDYCNPETGYVEFLGLCGRDRKDVYEENAYEIYDFKPNLPKNPYAGLSENEPEFPISNSSLLRFFIRELSEIISPYQPQKSPKQRRLDNFV